MATWSACSTTRTRLSSKVVQLQRPLRFKSLSTLSGDNKNDSNDLKPRTTPRQEPLTLLHKTSKLLPRVLPDGAPFPSHRRSPSREAWESILEKAFEDLSATGRRPARVSVYGTDECSGAHDLVTALLANPLNSDETQSNSLRERWKGRHQEKLIITYGTDAGTNSAFFQYPSTYLHQFPVSLEITELRSGPSASQSTTFPVSQRLEEATLTNLFEADIPIIVCNPLTTSLPTLLSTLLPSNTIIVLTSSTSQEIDLNTFLTNVPPNTPKPILILADPARASFAVHALQTIPNSPTVIQRFQDDFTGSNISTITRTLRSLLDVSDPTAKSHTSSSSLSSSDILRTKFAVLHVQDALIACNASVQDTRQLLDAVSVDVSHFTGRVEEAKARVENDVLGPQRPNASSHEKRQVNEVVEALKSAEKEMRDIMAHLTWWRMSLRVDEISNIVASAVRRTWCPELEKRLLIHTGHLSMLQAELSGIALSLLSKHPVLPTAVLRNTLLQLKSAPQSQLTPHTLTSPISSRRDQIIDCLTIRLHVAGQSAVLGMIGGIMGGAGMGWAGWMGWLVGSGEGLFGFVGMEPATSIGVGMLGAAVSVRWAVGKWERGKNRWWQDWTRVGEGLDRDLRVTLHQTMQQRVTGVAETASNSLTLLVQEREQEIDKVGEEVHQLQTDSNHIKDRA